MVFISKDNILKREYKYFEDLKRNVDTYNKDLESLCSIFKFQLSFENYKENYN